MSYSGETAAGFTSSNFTTTDTSGEAVTGMGFDIKAGQVWSFLYSFKMGASDVLGEKIGFNLPANAVINACCVGTLLAGLDMTDTLESSSLGIIWNTAGLTTEASGAMMRITGYVAATDTGGAVALKLAKVTSGTGTIYKGAVFQARRIS
jgi:hypothetical protein